jgi:rhodanese-related sulfurtransferase
MKKIALVLSCFLLVSCNNKDSEATNNNQDKVAVQASSNPDNAPVQQKQDPEMNDHGDHHHGDSNFKPNFIKADYLNTILDKHEKLYLFDVRGDLSYNELHIKGALSKPIPITPALVMGIPKDAKIVTYCGCPHHLSSIGAEQLTKLGYTDVHVLDEGFWYWKDKNYPMAKGKDAKNVKLSELNISGNLMKDAQPVSGKDIYIKHMKTGQLEATRTDKNGFYDMKFHIYDYESKDDFKFYVDDLKNPIQDFKTDKADNKNIIVKM